ncbi:transcription factor bHLH128-like isoform X2 [Salvia splendens]|uniref:transcription factor bHLH128-like isoform X2 n=1 Tax=Salvia splendens TaxID=180675 RepID=UPI001C27EF84|nr:transcription factor bHLH128-like isoform X2 [Salvia splendens]
MHPSSASSSSMSSGVANNGGGLMRYGSAPGSLLTAAADSVVGPPTREFSALGPGPARYFHHDASDSAAMQRRGEEEHGAANTTIGLQPSYGFGGGGGGPSSTALLRQSSSPAGFLNHLATAAGDRNGFSVTRRISSYNSKGIAETTGGGGISRLNSQLSFTGKESLSRISELEAAEAAAMDNHHQKKSYATTSGGGGAFGMWEANSNNPIMFSVAQPNRGKHVADSLDESQFQFSISQTAQDMEKLINNIPQDSVTCKIRAKRGFATHPRSIAERERRTRISGKLRKLQDLVPNMDKQTSYADMLDLAVQHIKTLQDQVEKLNHDLDNCSCGCKKTRDN